MYTIYSICIFLECDTKIQAAYIESRNAQFEACLGQCSYTKVTW